MAALEAIKPYRDDHSHWRMPDEPHEAQAILERLRPAITMILDELRVWVGYPLGVIRGLHVGASGVSQGQWFAFRGLSPRRVEGYLQDVSGLPSEQLLVMDPGARKALSLLPFLVCDTREVFWLDVPHDAQPAAPARKPYSRPVPKGAVPESVPDGIATEGDGGRLHGVSLAVWEQSPNYHNRLYDLRLDDRSLRILRESAHVTLPLGRASEPAPPIVSSVAPPSLTSVTPPPAPPVPIAPPSVAVAPRASSRAWIALGALGALGVIAALLALWIFGWLAERSTTTHFTNRDVIPFVRAWREAITTTPVTPDTLARFYAARTHFRTSRPAPTYAELSDYWTTQFDPTRNGATFTIDEARTTTSIDDLDPHAWPECAAVADAVSPTVTTVFVWATENEPDRARRTRGEIPCALVEGVYILRLRETTGGMRICYESWHLRQGVCASCPAAPACFARSP